MAKKKKSRRAAPTISIASVAGFGPLISDVWRLRSGGAEAMGASVVRAFTGYDYVNKVWDAGNLKMGILYPMLGILAHKVAGRLGVNRMLGRAKIPFVRI